MAEKKSTVKKAATKKTTKATPKKSVKEEKKVKFCQYCGAELDINAEACTKCGKFTAEHKKTLKKDTKIYKILCYFGILWLIGLLCEEKNDKDLKFHVGQGMLITILIFVITLINNLIIANIFVTTRQYWYYTYKTTSGLGIAIMWLLWLVPTVLSIIGIVNATKDEQKELPIIGKYAFYK